jgi:hypothetical protein
MRTVLAALLILSASAAFSQKKETRDVGDFNSVGLGIHAELYLTQGSPHELVIEASEDQLDRIETEVRNGHLKIKSESWRSNFKNVKIWVTMPEVNGLYLSGSGKMVAETPIESGELEMKVSGSGKIEIDELRGDELDVSISGSGDVYLKGSADEMELSISGSGGLHAAGLKVGEADVRLSGSGSCEIDATDELNAAISGSGKVHYFSNPQVDAAVSGSGKVRKGNR